MKQYGSLLLVFTFFLCLGRVGGAEHQSATSRGKNESVELTLFWQPSCPFCQRAKSFFENRPETSDWLTVSTIDLTESIEAQGKFQAVNRIFGIQRPGVPLMLVGERYFVGFNDASGVGTAVLDAARACRNRSCVTLAGLLKKKGFASPVSKSALPQVLNIPLIGEVPTATLSLPALTILLAAVDGFNPCAMWVLIFLVGLLVGIQDRMRMWILGSAFLLTSGFVYFGFLAAWLNVFLLLGALFWVRMGVGLVAIGSGIYYLHAFATNAAAECRVTNFEQRQWIMDSLRASVTEKRFLIAIAGIVALAAAVNLIELLCSASIPAVFTDVLATSNLPAWQHYLYLLLYVCVFMLDDAIIFAIAMLTLQATNMTNKYLRVSHLIGGVAMVTIGTLLLVAPSWLSFTV